MKLVREWWPVWLIVALMSTVLTLAIQSPAAVPVSPQAVYIEGLSCTVNMETTRSTDQIRKDLEACFSHHMSWKKRNDYGR